MGGPRWTRYEMLDAGNRFVQVHGRLPASIDAHSSPELPEGNIIRRVFGSFDAWRKLLVQPPQQKKLKKRACLMCGECFTPACKDNWVCSVCKMTEEWVEPTYMNGGVLKW